jgi:hypothetical protein
MTTFDYSKICRLCLCSTNTYLVNIRDDLKNVIHELVQVEINQFDNLPKGNYDIVQWTIWY